MGSAAKLRQLVVVLSVVVSVAALLSLLVWGERERSATVLAAKAQGVHSSQLLAQVIDGTFGGIDKVLSGLEASYRVLGDGNAEMLALLRRQASMTDLARGLLVIGADGISRYATNMADPYAKVNLADRDYFRVHLETAGRSFISMPLKSRNDGSWIVVASRSITGDKGEFLGVVAATISVDALMSEMKVALVDRNWAALLVDNQGVVLARSPDDGSMVGRSIAEMPAFRKAVGERRGGGITLSPLDGQERIFGFSRTNTFPLIAVVSTDSGHVHQAWIEHMVVPFLLVLVLLMLVALLVFRLLRQISKLEKAQGELVAAQNAASAAAKAKAAFVTQTSHELRTPLTTIIGFADTLVHGIPGQGCQPRCHEYLGYVTSAGRHLQAVINDLLDLTKIESGNLVIERVPVDLVAVTRETLRMLREAAQQKDVEIVAVGLDQALRVEGDNLRLRQLVTNLLSEALRMSPKGGQVSVSLSRTDTGEASISIVDQGIGMTGAELQSVMSPLGRSRPQVSRPGEGTGLGLALADQLAKLHRGRVEVISRKGEGTTTTAIFPLGDF